MNTNKKYHKNDIIRIYEQRGTGKHTKYVQIISDAELKLLRYANVNKYVKFDNDAKRGGKLGDHYRVIKYFSTNSMLKKQKSEAKELALKLKSGLKSNVIKCFYTISDIGCIVVDDVKYSNFYGDGENIVEVCECDFDEFRNAEFVTRRQIYNPNEPITIVKFDALKKINVAICDCDASHGNTTIDNVCGFAIWERKMKVFVANK